MELQSEMGRGSTFTVRLPVQWGSMSDPVSVAHDPERLAAVRRTGLLDTPPEELFDRLTRLATRILGVPVSFITLVDETRDFTRASPGSESCSLPLAKLPVPRFATTPSRWTAH